MNNELIWAKILSKIDAKPSKWKLITGDLAKSQQKLLSGKADEHDIKKLLPTFRSKAPFIDAQGNPFVLYIYDQSYSHKGVKEYKFHISWCKTLEDMRNKGRFARYKAKYDLRNSIFTVKRNGVERKIELKVCKFCLEKIKYNGYTHGTSEANQIYESFNLQEFLTEFASESLKELLSPTHQYSIGEYTPDWPKVRRRILQQRNYKCEECGTNKSLVVHHINGVKDDNRDQNLKVLCNYCHSKQPMHSHLR